MSSFEEKAANIRQNDIYKIERLKLGITEQICQKLKSKGMDRKDLARELGTSPIYITKILSGETNFTVETLYRICKVLDISLNVQFVP